ncbi:alpha/beta hydrolase [Wenzhouxiangella sp. XN201]|uniref:alpha/beta hydrolase n=1 Tax=Wenzhouxiangella sp. XN201 TaxID=2710755 RepID=UPI0013C6EC4A|nr:alpha/beta hydrolase [Wenzhouxiangella sp. XN201]NEZ02576.1 alpha/beta hydrolase [Wenzhouxiangella sp. XN201]
MRIDAGFRVVAIGWLLAGLILSTIAVARSPVEWREIVEQAQPEPGLRVSYGESPSQFGELYLPEGEGPFPLLVMIHGGCWRVEYGLDHVAPLADDLRQAGVAVWSLEYRRLGEAGGGWPGTFDDMAAGFDRIEELAESHPLDLDRVVLAGHSAGGHLALWLAARQQLPGDHRWHAEAPSGLRGVVGLAAISNLERYAEGEGACNRSAAEILGEDDSGREDRLALISPDRLLPPAVPVHLVHGREDSIVPLEQSVIHAARIRAAGGEAKRHIIESAGHFDLIAPFAEAWVEVRSVILAVLEIDPVEEE